eukprot:2644672-Pleurochrysis_carterae.AAC.4
MDALFTTCRQDYSEHSDFISRLTWFNSHEDVQKRRTKRSRILQNRCSHRIILASVGKLMIAHIVPKHHDGSKPRMPPNGSCVDSIAGR